MTLEISFSVSEEKTRFLNSRLVIFREFSYNVSVAFTTIFIK